jgi:hypothetical protein
MRDAPATPPETPGRGTELTRAVRAFLAEGGRIMIDPKGKLIDEMDIGLILGDRPGAERAYMAAVRFVRLRKRNAPRNASHLRRMVRLCGRSERGWTVLGRASKRPAGAATEHQNRPKTGDVHARAQTNETQYETLSGLEQFAGGERAKVSAPPCPA